MSMKPDRQKIVSLYFLISILHIRNTIGIVTIKG